MTVDGFQGQEKDIIILSCVRTGKGLGFITDVRRMVRVLLIFTYGKCVEETVSLFDEECRIDAGQEDSHYSWFLIRPPRLSGVASTPQ